MTKVKVAIVEIGGSHDECILSQVLALRERGCYVVFCGTRDIYQRNVLFQEVFDEFHEIIFPKTMLGDFHTMRRLSKWFVKNDVFKVIANTAQGGHIRNLVLTSSKRIEYYGIVHTIKMFSGSFTQWLISRKMKHFFVLNDALLDKISNPKGLVINSFYPLDYPSFNRTVDKSRDERWMVIIGGVENRRKDLVGFIDIAKNAPSNVKFIFLGKTDPKREEAKAFMEKLSEFSLQNTVLTFDYFIDQELFDAYLKNADGILPLVHPTTPSATEYFNRQISGALNIAFSYHIPLFVHEEYNNWDDFRTGVHFYHMDNCQPQLMEFIDKLPRLKDELESNPKFSKKAQRTKFAQIVLAD